MVLRLGLGPAIDNGVVFAASHKGEVLAAVARDRAPRLGQEAENADFGGTRARASGMVVVGTSKGAVVALDGATGRELWRAQLNSELLSAPAISDEGRRDSIGRRPAARPRCAHRQGAVVGGAAGAAPEPARHGDTDHRQGSGDQRLRQRQGDGGVAAPPATRFGIRPWHRRTAAPNSIGWSTSIRRCAWSATMSSPPASKDAPRCWRSIRGRFGGRTTCRATEAWRSMPTICTSPSPTASWWRCASATVPNSGAIEKLKLRRLEHAGGDQHGDRGCRLPGLCALAGQELRVNSWPGSASPRKRVTNSPVAVGDTVVVLTDGGNLAAYRATPAAAVRPRHLRRRAAPAARRDTAAPAAAAAPEVPAPDRRRLRRLPSLPRSPQLRRDASADASADTVGNAAGSRIDRSAECGQVDPVQCHDRHPRCVGRRSAGADARSAIRIRAAHGCAVHRGRYRRPGRECRRHRELDDCANRTRDQRSGSAHRAGGRPRRRHAAGSIRGATGAAQRQADVPRGEQDRRLRPRHRRGRFSPTGLGRAASDRGRARSGRDFAARDGSRRIDAGSAGRPGNDRASRWRSSAARMSARAR